MDVSNVKNGISYLLARVCHAHRNAVHAALSELDLHVGQEMFLLNLAENEGVTQSELAECLAVQQATVTRMLDRMARSNLVERRKDPDDQRVSRVFLTEAGRNLIGPIIEVWESVEAQVLVNFTPEERLLLRRFLLQLHDNLYD